MQIALDLAIDQHMPLQGRVVKQIQHLIRAGVLKPGTRLPGTRELSSQLSISRNTVTLAYERLTAEGFLSMREGDGTFVSDCPPGAAWGTIRPSGPAPEPAATRDRLPPYKRSPGVLSWDFQLETIDPSAFPSNIWRRLLLRRTQSSSFNMTRYGTPNGLLELRECIASYVGASRAAAVDPDQIVIVTGLQQALNIVARLMVRADTPVVVEAPGCSMIGALFRQYGARVLPVPVDGESLLVEHLPDVRGALVFVTPARQFPMGGEMSLQRRQALLAWAQRTDSNVLEVDFDSEFHYDSVPQRALQALDTQGRVLHAGSFSTSIGPGLRIGYLILPAPLVAPAIDVIRMLDFGMPCHGIPWLEQAVLTDFIQSGGFESHLRRVRRLYMSRRDRLVSSLRQHFPGALLSGVESGTHLAWQLPREFPSAMEMQSRLQLEGVGTYTLRDTSIADAEYLDNWPQTLLLGFASQTEEAIARGVDRMATVFR